MRWSDLPLDPPPRMLRQFAALWLVVLGGMAAWQGLVHERPTLAWILGVLALVVGPLGLWQPAWVRPVFRASILVTFPIGWVVSQVVLAGLYYGLFTPMALIFRLRGRDALALKPSQPESYWSPKPMPEDPRRYFRQY